ncbi:MAG TPA: RT0821/Lpp0805 family surface protein [Stellaceae bacterium]|nr:RT0821/Lpp0805 family surface protein [Stellaceae bacterium]
MRKMIAVVGLSLSLAACQQPGGPAAPGEFGMNKTTGGTLVGAGLGGLLGNQFGSGAGKGVATLAGVLVGGFLGSQVGKSLDEADLQYANRATQTSLESAPPGQTLPWRNPQSGHYGTVTPERYYQTASGQYCREFQQTITIGGQTQEGYGTACRQPDGTWKIIQ